MSKTIVVDGVEYVRKDSIKEVSVSPLCDRYVIVRTYSAGVFAGEIVSRKDAEIVLRNARRLWYWDGASSLSQLAVDGVTKPQNCKFPCEVEKITLLGVIEIISATKKAQESIKGVAIWKQ